VSCAKTAEQIEMQFGRMSRVGPVNMYYMGCIDAPTRWCTVGLSGRGATTFSKLGGSNYLV